jgi:hypothetical protein
MRPGEIVNSIEVRFSISSKLISSRLLLGISLDELISTTIIKEKDYLKEAIVRF